MFGFYRTVLLAIFAIHLAFAPATLDAQTPRLVLLDGNSVSGAISAISHEGVVTVDGIDEPLELEGLRSIDLAKVTSRPPNSKISVQLAGGGILHARGVTIRNEESQVTWRSDQQFTLSIDALHAIKFNASGTDGGFDRALNNPSPQSDRVFAEVEDDKIQTFPGLLVELSDSEVVFMFRGKERKLPRKKVFGIVFAQVAGGAGKQLNSMVQLRDGSLIPGNLDSLVEGTLQMTLVGETAIKLPWDAIASIRIRSSRLAYLSDLNPEEEKQAPIVTIAHPWQRDRSVLGAPLTLRDKDGSEQVFRKGVGVHARSELTFSLDSRFDEFAATIGIDAETEGRGNCEFIVIADRKRVFSQQVKGSEPLRKISVDVSGVEMLTLLVDPGADLDLADHADWCDARLIRKSKK